MTHIDSSPEKIPDIAMAPRFSLVISNDLMGATLIIEPAGNSSTEITAEQIREFLLQNGINTGIDESIIHMAVKKWQEHKRLYEHENIARGIPPEPAKEGALNLKVRYISNLNDLEKIKQSNFFWQIVEFVNKVQKVTPGTLLAEKRFGKPSMPGKNIKGELIFTDDVIRSEIKTSSGVSVSSDGSKLTSSSTGLCYFVDNTIGVLEFSFDGSVELVISQDQMSALFLIHQAGEGGSMPGENEIRKILLENNVCFGINDAKIAELVYGFRAGKYPSEPVVIAEGKLPKNGENGKVEFAFNTETSLKPKQNSDGSVDYKSINIINSVSKNQLLATLVPPTKGISGKDVRGVIVKPTDGSEVKLPSGTNTHIDPSDPSRLLASVDGVVRFTGTTVEVNEGFLISGNVDFSTGNIKYEKSVIVNGDVKSGFDVDCGGDLQVGGTIEDSHLVVGGNVLCKYGFIGQGRGLLETKGDVNLSFSKNQTIKCRKNVNIAKEALNCRIFARNSIIIHGKPLSAAGGTLSARDSIILYSVGNQTGIKTFLEVGLDFILVEELEKTEKHFIELATNYSKLNESYKKYEKIISIKRSLSSKEQDVFDKLVVTMAKHKQQMDVLEERKKIITSKMYQLNGAFVKIEHSAMPGTLIKIGERHHLIKEELVGPKTIRLIDHEIRVI